MKARYFGLLFIGGLIVAVLWLVFIVTNFPAALKPAPYASDSVLIQNVHLISMAPNAPEIEEKQAVLVVEGQISAIGPVESIAPPADALVVDGQGRYLLPGLIDAHVHVWDEAELAGYLVHGVTGVRNMSGFPFHVPLGERIASGKLLGPDFQTTGPILNSHGPNENALHQIVETAEESRAAVKAQYKAGYRALKVYANLKREPYEAILAEAHGLGMRVTGHTPEGVREPGMPDDKAFDIPFEQSLGRGLTTIEHVESIVWHGLRDRLDEDQMRQLAAKIAQSGDAVTPTLIAHDNLVRVAASKGAYLKRPGVETINPALRFFDKGNYAHWSVQDPAWREGPRTEFYQKATKILHDAGVPLVAGTDAGIFTNIPGSSMTREMELFVKAGLTPYEALGAATRVAADVLGFEKTGIIATGYRANMILLDDNPLENISALENPSAVMVRGYWLDAAALQDLRKAAGNTSFIRSMWRIIQMKLAF